MKKLSFAIIGSGPAGFYIAKALAKMPQQPLLHIYQKEYCPFGLIRYGVAPDHISIKKSQIALSSIASYNGFKYCGNQQVTNDLLTEFKQQYSGIIYAIGAQKNQEPQWFQKALLDTTNIKNSILNARQIVYWYNNHPQYEQYSLDLSNKNNVVIIGNGNVAIDIARVLLKNYKDLANTQISQNSLQSLQHNSVKNISIIARRGFTHSAFSIKEIRQLDSFKIKIYCIWEELQESMNGSSYIECTSLGDHNGAIVRVNKRKLDFIQSKCLVIKKAELEKVMQDGQKKIILRYLLDPLEISNNEIKMSVTRLQGEPFKQLSVHTDKQQTLQFDLLVNSTGFKVEALREQLYDGKSNSIANSDGCVLTANQSQKIDIGTYAVGWCKNGPRGVLDQTLLSCEQTFNNIRIHVNHKLLVEKQSPMFNTTKTVDFTKYMQLRDLQLGRGDRQLYIKKKLKIAEVRQFFGV